VVIDFANPASITIHGECHIENAGEFGSPLKRGRITETKLTNISKKSTKQLTAIGTATTMTIVKRKTVKHK